MKAVSAFIPPPAYYQINAARSEIPTDGAVHNDSWLCEMDY